MSAIRIEGLTKRYRDVVAVDRLSLCIEEGELFSLLGVNGAGKTTTIKMLSCLAAPTDGDAWLLGNSIRKDTAKIKSLIAVSPQETARSYRSRKFRTDLRRLRFFQGKVPSQDPRVDGAF